VTRDAEQREFRPPRVLTALVLAVLCGCMSADRHREKADGIAQGIVEEKQLVAFGLTEGFTIEPPDEDLHTRLIEDQQLPHISPPADKPEAQPGKERKKLWKSRKDRKEEERTWRERLVPEEPVLAPSSAVAEGVPSMGLTIDLLQALQIGARHSRAYQSAKETVFETALSLDLERDEFTNTFSGSLESIFEYDRTEDSSTRGVMTSGVLDVARKFKNGVELTGGIAFDLANLLSQGGASSLGILADTSISIPLLRGSGWEIVTADLTQAERSVVYAVCDFERYKRTFAVSIASQYFGVLRQRQQLRNYEENYRRLVAATRRARRLADAGRLPEFQFDQAIQDELRSRSRWIASKQGHASSLDQFKLLLGLPADARMELDESDLAALSRADVGRSAEVTRTELGDAVPPADAVVVLVEPSRADAGPFEMDPDAAVRIALTHRLDLREAYGRVADAERGVRVAADALRAELTLLGSASSGGSQSVSSATSDDVTPSFDEGSVSAGLTLDLPFERTSERASYRSRLIDLSVSKRDLVELEDDIKVAVRGKLRDLLEYREGLVIQAQAVELAEKRVKSTDLFLQAGRAAIRDVLEAQDDLLSAQNSMTSALVNYRIAELELQRDMGVLKVDADGLWHEYRPGEAGDDER